MHQTPEYHGMICLSTAHLTAFAMHYLHENCQNKPDGNTACEIPVYPKDDYGYFIAITSDMAHDDSIPASIRQCISYAESHQADWLMFDHDGPIMNELPAYDDQ